MPQTSAKATTNDKIVKKSKKLVKKNEKSDKVVKKVTKSDKLV